MKRNNIVLVDENDNAIAEMECNLKFIYSFIHNEQVENNLTEHGLDYVVVSCSDQSIVLNRDEVKDYKWIHADEILSDLKNNPSHYTVCFKQAFPGLLSKINQ